MIVATTVCAATVLAAMGAITTTMADLDAFVTTRLFIFLIMRTWALEGAIMARGKREVATENRSRGSVMNDRGVVSVAGNRIGGGIKLTDMTI